MSASWSQGGQPPATATPRRNVNPPPVCFNCGQEGHFVVACPEPSRLNPGSFPPPPPPQQQYQGQAPPPQPYQPQAGPPQAQYPPQPQNQQYGPPAPPSYSQPLIPQPYSAPPATIQYGRSGYQPPPYNQYPPQSGSPQYGSPAYQNPPQQYGPPANAPYQPPNYYPTSNVGYGGNYGASPVPYQPPQQWNNAPPTSRSAPPYQRQQRNRSQQGYQREFSGTPGRQSHQQMPQQGHGSDGYHQTPQTPGSNPGNQQNLTQGSQGSPTVALNESRASSRASTPYGRRGSAASVVQKLKAEPGTPSGEEQQKEQAKAEFENLQPEDEEQQFNWDFKHIFKEPPKPESVALAQPLSTTFDMTPVPQVDPRSTRSVSRYARNENIKEFIRSIRSAPQWSYLQEDPAFTDAKLEGPLIPVEDIPAWIANRHGIQETPENEGPVESSRKRAWSEEQDVDNQIKLQAGEEAEGDGHTNKRQKNEETGELDEQMADAEEAEATLATSAPGTPVLGTPVLGRSGTPCLANVDDAWAPQPGEGAAVSSPEDPTEALLASLGVTGSPKPVKDEPLPPYVVPVEDKFDCQASSSSQPQQAIAPVSTTTSPNPHQGNGQGQPMDSQYGNESQSGPQYGPPSNSPYGNPPPAAPHGNPPYPPPRSASWSSGPPINASYGPNPQGNVQYGPPIDHTYHNGPPTSMPHGNPEYGPPRSASYPNVQYGPPQYNNAPPPTLEYSSQPQYGNGPPPNAQHNGPPQYSNGPPPNVEYGAPQYANSQYTNPPPRGPPQYINGPQPPFGNTPQGPPQYASDLQNQPLYGNAPQGPPQYTGGATNQPPYGNAPLRQDSGYMSARGSYSNGSGQNGFNHNPPSTQPVDQYAPPDNVQNDNQPANTQQPEENGQSEEMDRQNSTSGEIGTPLSPTSAEILGKLVRKPSNAKKAEPSRQSDEIGGRKVKRPQPVVAEAYSRRW